MTDTMTRPDAGSCSCGCGDPANAQKASESTDGCSCGCGSQAETPAMTLAREVAHLTELRQSIDRRLAELKS